MQRGWVFAGILIVVILGAALFFLISQNTLPEEDIPRDELPDNSIVILSGLCDKSPVPQRCYSMTALFSGNEELCAKSVDPKGCAASVRGDRELCSQAAYQEACLYNVMMKTRDSSICTSFRRSGDCYYSLAMATQNISLCDLAYKPQTCRAILSKNPALCNEPAGLFDCYEEIAVANKEGSLCPRMAYPRSDQCFIRVAIASGDHLYCEKTQQYSSCVYDVAIAHANAALCDKSWDGFSCKGVLSRDVSQCPYARDTQQCYHHLAIVKEDDKLCDFIAPGVQQSQCYQDVALLKTGLVVNPYAYMIQEGISLGSITKVKLMVGD